MKKQVTDSDLRELVTGWVRTALGELVADASTGDVKSEQSAGSSLRSPCDKVETKKSAGELAARK